MRAVVPRRYLTPRKLRRWLRRQPRSTLFQPNTSCNCPLAWFFTSTVRGARITYVGTDIEVCRPWGTLRYRLPDWALDFVLRVDTAHLKYHAGTIQLMGPRRALELLDEVAPTAWARFGRWLRDKVVR